MLSCLLCVPGAGYSTSPLSGFMRRLFLRVLLQDEKVLISVSSSSQLYKGPSNAMSAVIPHPRYGAGHKHRAVLVSLQSTCAEILAKVSGESMCAAVIQERPLGVGLDTGHWLVGISFLMISPSFLCLHFPIFYSQYPHQVSIALSFYKLPSQSSSRVPLHRLFPFPSPGICFLLFFSQLLIMSHFPPLTSHQVFHSLHSHNFQKLVRRKCLTWTQ